MSLRRLRTGLASRLDADDPATPDTLIDGEGPGSLPPRDDLTIRHTRAIWVARRP
ncbi:hypothetical protein ACWC0A_36255 [Streptomyces scopuliridis]